jgi:hypothetical protein
MEIKGHGEDKKLDIVVNACNPSSRVAEDRLEYTAMARHCQKKERSNQFSLHTMWHKLYDNATKNINIMLLTAFLQVQTSKQCCGLCRHCSWLLV